MICSAVQMVCVASGALGLIGVIRCCTVPQWTMTSFMGSNIVTAQVIFKGLWMECVKQSTGQQWCKVYDSILALPSDLQLARFLTVISCIFSGLSLLILLFGADFTTCVQNKEAKPKIILVAGVGLMLAGLLVIIPVSWSAHNTVRDQLVHTSWKRELGACIYIGWAAGVLMLLAGGLLCCFGRSRSSSSEGSTSYHSNRASVTYDDVM